MAWFSIMSTTSKSPRRVFLAAMDSTCIKSHDCSRYFVKRRSRVEKPRQTTTTKQFPQRGSICDVSTVMFISMHVGHVCFAWRRFFQIVAPVTLFADALVLLPQRRDLRQHQSARNNDAKVTIYCQPVDPFSGERDGFRPN